MHLRAVALAVVFGGLAACGGDDTPPSCLPACPGDRDYDARAYHLSAEFDWVDERLHAVESITVQPASGVLELDADVDVTAVTAGSRQLAYALDREAGTLRVDVTPLIGDGFEVTFNVEYTAEPSDALVIAGPRDDDPVPARVLYTDSEPDRGVRWLVAKHDPSDRARWSVDVTMPMDHDVIANGERVDDQAVGLRRLVSYRLEEPIPTYLMAFATGELSHVERTDGPVPLALWFRRGLAIEPDDNLDVVADAMATFSELLGPYPWDSYAVVLLPGFGGGMENATITFNDESSGLGTIGFNLNAHELAHQWFGDWVTMRTYDDVWVKEGMATFLASEAARASRDEAATGRSYGADFNFFEGHAIVDPSLTGLSKYNSGPYQRAAWLITQVRALVGETAFRAGLRRVLADHALDDVSGAEFLASFGLPDAERLRLEASLLVTGVPRIDVATATDGADQLVSFTLTDDTSTLHGPFDVVAIAPDGTATTAVVQIGAPTTVRVPPGGYVAPDPRGLHPWWSGTFAVVGSSRNALRPLLVPTAAPALADYLARSPAHQELSVGQSMVTLPPAAAYEAFHDALDSTTARRSSMLAACARQRTLAPPDATVLADFLRGELWTPPAARFGNYAACDPALATEVLADELRTLAVTPALADRAEYMFGFDYGPAASLQLLTRFATQGATLRLRELALTRLVNHASGRSGYSTIVDRGPWIAFFRDRLPVTTSSRRLELLWNAVLGLEDTGALPLVAPLLHSVPMTDELQRSIVCDASILTAGDPAAWAAFQSAAQPWSELSAGAAAALADPTTCPTFKPTPTPPPADADHQHHLHAR